MTFICGLGGPTIEPLVPLLTFIGSIELDKSIEDHMTNNKTVSEKQEKKRVKGRRL